MGLPLSLAVYFTLWWVVLFAMLPIGVQNANEAPDDRPTGADKGAPVRPMMAKKVVATTLLAAALFALVDAYVVWWS